LQNKARDLIATLSCREKQVFEGLVRGGTIKGIASQENLSPRTVEKYRYRMQQKMETNSLTMLVRYAIALGTEFHGLGGVEELVPDA
jgi:two-component system, LuxR family, response regulator FixJ